MPHRKLAFLFLLVTLGRCSDSTAPASPVTVTVTASPQSILPGQSLSATIAVVPPGNAQVDFVKITTSGVYTSAESLAVHLAGTFSATRFFSIPASAGTGTLTILATAAAGGATGNGETRVAVADTVPPVISQFSVSPADSAQPGDSLTVTLTVSDNAALRYSIIRLSGPATLKDSVDHAYASSASRVLRLRLPPTTSPGNLSVTAQVVDVGGHTVTTAARLLTVRDTRPPLVLATLANRRGTPGVSPGDTLTLSLFARDNAQLQLTGYRFGAPANVQDSFPATDTAFSRTVTLVVPAGWAGTSTYSVYARDAAGNARQVLLGTFTVANRVRQAPWSAALDATVRDMAYDPKRNVVYLSQTDSGRVAVLSLGSRTFGTSLPFTGAPHGLDLSLGGDSLLVAQRNTPYVTVVNLVSGQRDTVRVNADNFLNRGPDNVRVMGNNKALITITFAGSGYGGSLVELDLATRAYKNRVTVTEFVPLCRSADRSTALVLIDDSCCPIEGVVYDALSATFPADKGTVSQYFNFASADFIGGHFLVTGALFDRTLNSRGTVAPSSATGPSVLAPDGTAAYFATTSGVTRVRLSDGAVVDSFILGAQPYQLAIAPDGLTLFAATATQLFVIDLW
jgi:methionine-rich copper-binding protein CopC